MQTTFSTARTKPANPSRAIPRSCALIFVPVGFVLATLISASSEALSDTQARGEMDGIATANSDALALVILLAAIVLALGLGIRKMIEADAHDLMDD
jgi:hypothetical protein